jgi:copper chaperone NosL
MKDLLLRKLSTQNRLLILGVGILLVSVYFVPIWFISLAAPQYPEGLGMKIWINKVAGSTPYDLQNINLLNHYIGMHEIISESIPELLFMPYVLGYLIVGAFITFIYPKVYMVVVGILNFILLGIVGLSDFWRWEYNYGHNLNPDAPIIVPGMAYQPPLLGCKEMLNITACSFPSWGGIVLLCSLLVLVFIILSERRKITNAA